MALLKARRAWMFLHRWTGLTLGLLLAFVALLGATLTVARPADEWANAQFFHAPAAAPGAPGIPLEPLRQALATEFGPTATMTLRPPREPHDTFWVLVRSPGWDGTLYLDPATGRELGRRGDAQGFANVLFKLHSSLLMGDTGKATLAITAGAYLALLLTGLILWWPTTAAQWRHAFGLKVRGGTTRALFDLHRFGGAVLGLAIAVSVATGAYMAWRPLGAWISGLAGEKPVTPPKTGPARGPQTSLDALVATAQARWPGGRVGYVQFGSATRPVRVRMKLPDDPHPNGLSSVWLHPVDGRVLAAQRWNELDLGGRATSYIYPLHTGELGGTPHTVLNGLMGLTLAGLGISGTWLWWRRRR